MEQNPRIERQERLTRIGPGTPMGEYMRRFWHPVATAAELAADPVLPVRLLGERLALYRGDDGSLGLVAERCAHRARRWPGMVAATRSFAPITAGNNDATGACIETRPNRRQPAARARPTRGVPGQNSLG